MSPVLVTGVLRAARDAGARRVVLTSSFAAVGYSPKPDAEYTGSAHSQSGYRPRKRREMSCLIWSSTTTAPATSSAGDRVPPKPRSSRPPRACATLACWRSDNDEW